VVTCFFVGRLTRFSLPIGCSLLQGISRSGRLRVIGIA